MKRRILKNNEMSSENCAEKDKRKNKFLPVYFTFLVEIIIVFTYLFAH